MRALSITVQMCALSIWLLWVDAPLAKANPYSLSYGGRVTDGEGKPLDGSVILRAEFFRTETGGYPINTSLSDFTVNLQNGVFQLPIAFSGHDFQTIFNGTDAVWIQITDVKNRKTYPRQSFSAVPYALKVPVDEAVFSYDSDGKLTLSAPPEDGKYLSSSGGVLSWSAPAGSGDMNRINYDANSNDVVDNAERLGGQLPSYYTNASNITSGTLPAAQVPSIDAAKVTTGNFGASRITTDANNRFVSDSEKTAWNDAVSWGNHADAGYASRSDFSVNGGGPLTYNNTNGQFSLGAASTFSDGYLSSTNFGIFNSKQNAINSTTNLDVGELSAYGYVRLLNDAGAQGVTIKARDNLAASWTLTLPPNPGSSGDVLSTDGNGLLSWIAAGGVGDMKKSVYDSNNDGKVDSAAAADTATTATTAANATQLGGQAPSFYLDAANLTGTIADARIPAAIARDSEIEAGARAAVSSGSSVLSYSSATGVFGMSQATIFTDGYLSSEDWSMFKNKQDTLGFTPLNKAGDTMGANLAMGDHKITALAEPDDAQDAATKNYVDNVVAVKQNDLGFTPLNAAGGTISGNLTVSGQLTVSGGAPGAGKVLTSNASGVATWETPSASGNPSFSSSALSPNDAVYVNNAGRVGIGTQNPETSLHVAGPVSTGHGGIKWKTFAGSTSSGDLTTFSHGISAGNVLSFNCMVKSTDGHYYTLGYLEGASSLNRLVRISGNNAEIHHQGAEEFRLQQYRCIAQFVDAIAGVDGFSASTGTGLSGNITVSIDFPGDTSNYDYVEVRRIAGATAPSASCDGAGDSVTTLTNFTDTSYVEGFADDGIVGGTFHSYRLCIYGTDDSLISFSIAQNVQAKTLRNVEGFTAVQGTINAGDINASISFPAAEETASYNRVEVRRIEGSSPPAATCNGGSDDVRTFTTYTSGAFVDETAAAGSYYSYRVCVFGHDGSLVSSTTVANVRSKPACDGVEFNGYCWYKGAPGTSCTVACSTHGGTNDIGGAWAAESNANCEATHTAMGHPSYAHATLTYGSGKAIGCFMYNGNERFRENTKGYAAGETHGSNFERVCACQY